MIALRQNPVGVDKLISSLQKKLYAELPGLWDIEESKYNCFARCYRNQTKTGEYMAEVFDGGTEYREVYFDDNVSVTSFFGISQEARIAADNMMTADIHLIFFVNLGKIKPDDDRNDQEARIDVQRIVDHFGMSRGFSITKQVLGLDKILAEYPGTRKEEGLKFKDQHPLHAFRFDMQVFYQPTTIEC